MRVLLVRIHRLILNCWRRTGNIGGAPGDSNPILDQIMVKLGRVRGMSARVGE